MSNQSGRTPSIGASSLIMPMPIRGVQQRLQQGHPGSTRNSVTPSPTKRPCSPQDESISSMFGCVPQSIAEKRLHSDLQVLKQNPVTSCHAHPNSEGIYQWAIVIDGPVGTLYEGGTFFAEMRFCEYYPFVPPDLVFLTRIYHPNICNGRVCLDTISKSCWKPSTSITTVLQSLVSLLHCPNPRTAISPEIADEMLHRPNEFEQMARMWTERYAQ